MTGPELLGLERPLEVGRGGERGPDLVATVAIDDVNGGRRDPARGTHDVLEQRSAREGLEHFRQRRVHALTLPRGENDYGNRHRTEPRGTCKLGMIARGGAGIC
jgi:hypothetical protein